MTVVRQIRMRRRPAAVPEPDDLEIADIALPPLGEGDVLMAPHFISLDPYIRLRMAGRHLIGNLEPGDAISSEMVGTVLASRSPDFAEGATVAGFTPWQDQAVLPGAELRAIDFGDLSPSLALGILGMPGLTACAGITQLLKPGVGDVLVVSAAAGPVGATVGQLAMARGAKAIGIAGSPEKCRWVVEDAGFDACIDYKREDVAEALARLVPERPSCYFDNVGGALLRTMIGTLRAYGRVALCGIMADYNSADLAPGPLPLEIISARATIMGLVVYDFEHLREEMITEHRRLIATGRLKWREDVAYGLENAPAAFSRLMRGENEGKALVCLAR
jgi:NADPH-dependent curcumin reductase